MVALLFSFLLYFSLASVLTVARKLDSAIPRPVLKKQRRRAHGASEEQCTDAAQTSL